MRIAGTRIRRGTAAAIALVVLTTAVILLSMGRPAICTCGTIKLWEGMVNSSGNSQHLADWYSFSHIIHGFLFYAATWWTLGRKRGASGPALHKDQRLLLAVILEAGWELLENSPIIIDRYRTATVALGYTGDSVLNSASDIAMMAAGFLFAARVRARVTIILAIAFELMTLAVIRDNLTLNILMLTWPVDAIKAWQGAL